MAQIVLIIPDDKLQRVINGICGQCNYQETFTSPDGVETPNPEPKSIFAKRMLARFAKDCVQGYEARVAELAAREAIITDVNTINIT